MKEQQGHITNDPEVPTPPANNNPGQEQATPPGKRHKKHLIKTTWLRRLIKSLVGVLIFILLLPVLVYIPFVQDWLKDAACYFVSKSTGMTVQIERFRLKFPLDVQLDGVLVLTEKGDTMEIGRAHV